MCVACTQTWHRKWRRLQCIDSEERAQLEEPSYGAILSLSRFARSHDYHDYPHGSCDSTTGSKPGSFSV